MTTETNAEMIQRHAPAGTTIKLAYERCPDRVDIGLITPDGEPWNFDSDAPDETALIAEYEQALPGRVIQIISMDEYQRLKHTWRRQQSRASQA
jgi:hypothetical protein